MSLSKDAIEHVEQNAIAVAAQQSDAMPDFPFRLLPSGMNIASLEPFMVERNQFRAAMKTRSIEDFVKYFEEHQGENCFINAEQMTAKTIFDLGDSAAPLHCHHKAYLSLQKTAAFKELERVNGNLMYQRDMADRIEEWHDLIIPQADTEGKETIALSKAVASIRRMTVEEIKKTDHEARSSGQRKTSMEDIEAKSDESLPGYFSFTCTPYEGLKEQIFALRLSVLTSHDAPAFKLRVQRFESIEENLATEFRDLLVKKLPENAKTFIGELNT